MISGYMELSEKYHSFSNFILLWRKRTADNAINHQDLITKGGHGDSAFYVKERNFSKSIVL